MAGTLAAYSFSAHEPQADFTYANPSGIHTLDPARMSWTQDFRVALNIWEGLTTLDPQTLAPTEGAAHFPPEVSDDGMTYRFHLREDARWSNGDPVVAGDFVRSWRRAMEPGTAADYAFLFTDVLAGAAEYVEWRRRGVTMLTALSRLKDGWSITAEQAEALLRHPFARQVPELRDRLASFRETSGGDNVDWSNVAARLSAEDLPWAAMHERALAEHASAMDARFANVSVDAPDDHTLVVTLRRPCPYFADLLALPVFYPCHRSIERLRERHGDLPITDEGLVVYDPQWTKPDYHRSGYPGLITNGPYHLAEWTFKRRARLAVNPFFRDAATVGCRTVDMVVFDNINAALMAYEAGDLDFLPSMSVSYDHEIARLSQSGERPDYHLAAVSATNFLNFNCESKEVGGRANPFVDARIRRAFALAIDKQRIVKNVLKRGDRVAHSLVPPGAIPGYDPPAGLTRDVEEARRLLAEAGHADGEGLGTIELLCTSRDERLAQTVARIWQEELHIRVDIRTQESKTFAEDKANRRYMVARGNWYADYNDPTTYLRCLTTDNGNNDSGFSDPDYDALIERADAERDPQARFRLLREAEAMIVEESLPIVPIFHYAEPLAIRPAVHGLHANARLWFPFRYVTVER